MLRFCRGRVQISFGFLLLSAWFAWGCGWEMLAAVMLASAVHELGHFLALVALGVRVRGFRAEVLGMVMEAEVFGLSYPGELGAVLAGPAANLLFAAALSANRSEEGFILMGANIVLCLFNLLPVLPLDGGRAAQLSLIWLFGVEKGERLAWWMGQCCGLILGAGLLLLMCTARGNLWLLPPALAALGGATKGRKKAEFFRKKCLHS